MTTGRVFRRCACRGPDGRQLGKGCRKLAADSRDGTWSYALEQPNFSGRRVTLRRAGFTTRKAAKTALASWWSVTAAASSPTTARPWASS